MKKTTYLVMISVITIVCVIVGSIYHMGGFSIPGVFHIGSGKSDTKVTSIEMDDGSVSADTVDLDKFSNIDMELQVMDVTIQNGDSFGISYECNKKEYVPIIDVVDDVLTVKQNVKKKKNIRNVKCKMILTVPENTALDNVEIHSDVGDIKINDMTGDTSYIIGSDTGDVKFAGVSGEELTINVDTGDVKLSKCDFASTNISGDTGDVELANCVSLGEITVDNDTGDIVIIDCKMTKVEVSDDTGDISFDNCRMYNGDINISTDTGDVEIEGVENLNKYMADFTTDIGDVRVNGKNYKKHYSEEARDLEEVNSFTISTNIGNIVVD